MQRGAAEHGGTFPGKLGGRFSRIPVLPALLLVALVAALVGAALASLLVGGSPADDSLEAGFARDMLVHHAQAAEMAEIVRDNTQDDEVRLLASDIAITQQGQIGQLEGWLAVWGLSPTRTGPAMAWMGHPTEGRMPGMASPEKIQGLREASSDEVDVRFLQLMIPHHQAALPMAEAARDSSDRLEVVRLAGAIANAQEAEIATMKDMLQSRDVTPDEAGSSSGDSMPSMEHHG